MSSRREHKMKEPNSLSLSAQCHLLCITTSQCSNYSPQLKQVTPATVLFPPSLKWTETKEQTVQENKYYIPKHGNPKMPTSPHPKTSPVPTLSDDSRKTGNCSPHDLARMMPSSWSAAASCFVPAYIQVLLHMRVQGPRSSSAAPALQHKLPSALNSHLTSARLSLTQPATYSTSSCRWQGRDAQIWEDT